MWLAGACAAPAAAPPPTPSLLTLAATDTAAPLVRRLAQAYRLVAPEILPAVMVVPQLALSTELATGRADLAFTVQPPAGLFAAPAGVITFTLAAPAGGAPPALSAAQARALLAGAITDWAQVGGPAGPVQVVLRAPEADAGPALAAAWLGAFTPPAAARLAPTWAAVQTLLSETPGAIGYLPEDELTAALQPVTLGLALRADLAAVSLAEPAGAARNFLAWAQSPAGQAAASRK